MQDTVGEVGTSSLSDVLLWTPSPRRAKAGRPARTYIQQLCADTRCNPEDLPETIYDMDGWQEKVMDMLMSWCDDDDKEKKNYSS